MCRVWCKCSAQHASDTLCSASIPPSKKYSSVFCFCSIDRTMHSIVADSSRHRKSREKHIFRHNGIWLTPVLFIPPHPEASMSETSSSKTIRATQVTCCAAADGAFDCFVPQDKSMRKNRRTLNLSRSTAWTVLRGNYKTSGLSGKIVKRMLASPQLPLEARRT